MRARVLSASFVYWAHTASPNLRLATRRADARSWVRQAHLLMSQERYTDQELEAFRANVEKKLARAREDFEYLQNQINELSQNSDEAHSADYIDGSAAHMDIQRMNEMAKRQLATIEELEAAKVRIRQGTYGICTITGEKIDPKRLKLVPGARRSVEGERLFHLGKAEDKEITV